MVKTEKKKTGKTGKKKTEKRKTKQEKQKNKTRKTTPTLTEHFSPKQKQAIVDALNPITEENIVSSWEKLRALKCKGAIAAAAGIRLGNDIVDNSR